MAEAAAAVLLENLSHLFTSSADLISGAEDEIQHLKNEVELLRVLLENAASKPKKEEPFAEVGRQIQEMVDGAELLIDAHLCRAAAAQCKIDHFRRRHGALDREPNSSLAEAVRSLIKYKVKPMVEKARIGFANMLLSEISHEEAHQIKVKEVSSSGLLDSVLGLQDEEEFIIGCLEQGPLSLDVLSIVGMPGLGKTTIARRIYQSPKIQYEYPTRIWVYVSRDFNKKDVFLNILKGVTSKDMSGMSSRELALIVHDFLEKRRFFLVLDDVWDRRHYIAIREALPKSHKGNKVLITSRFEKISDCSDLADTTPMLILNRDGNFETIEVMNPPRHPHKLRRLSDDESWELLWLEVFGKHNSCPRELLDLWRRIADAVHGVPLVIGIVGGILLGQLSKTQSMSALKKEWKELSVVLAISRYHENIHYYVELSYIRLPNELGNLFLYLGMFPEDYKIPVTTLIRLWIAEGFIQRKEGRSL